MRIQCYFFIISLSLLYFLFHFVFSSVCYILSSFPLLWLPVSAPPVHLCATSSTCLPFLIARLSSPFARAHLLNLSGNTPLCFCPSLIWLEGCLHAHCCPTDGFVGPYTVGDTLMLKHGTVKLGAEGSLRTSCFWGDSSYQSWRTWQTSKRLYNASWCRLGHGGGDWIGKCFTMVGYCTWSLGIMSDHMTLCSVWTSF